jgi:hypothetical protein
MSRPCALYPGVRHTTEGKSTGKKKKTPVGVVEKYQLGTIPYVDMANFREVVLTSPSIPVYLGTLGRSG